MKNQLMLSIICFLVALSLFFTIFLSTTQTLGFVFLMILLVINLVFWVFARRDSGSVLSDILLKPILLLTLDTFVLRLGLLNYYQYVEDSWFPFVTPKVLNKTALLVIVSNLALWFAYQFFTPAKTWGKRLAAVVYRWSNTEYTVSEAKIWLFFLIGISMRVYLVSLGGGGYFGDASVRMSLWSIIQYLSFIESLAPLCMCLYFALVLKGKGGSWPGFAIMFSLELTTMFLIGFKGQVVFRFLYLGIVYAFLMQRTPYHLVLLGLIALLFIYPVNIALRAAFVSGSFQAGDIRAILSNTANIMAGAPQSEQFALGKIVEDIVRTSANLEQFAMAVQYTDRTGGLYGEDLLYFFYSFVPRIIWPSKPVIGARGGWFYNVVYGLTANSAQTTTVPGSLYLNFGWPGIVFGFLWLGGLLRVGEEVLVKIIGSERIAALIPFLVFGLALPSSMFFLHIASMMYTIPFLVLVLALFLVPAKQTPHYLGRLYRPPNALDNSTSGRHQKRTT